MTRGIPVLLAVIAVTLTVVVVSIDARRSGNIGGSGGGGGSGGDIVPISSDNYDPFSTDCGNYNGNYDSLPGNYEISPLGNYNANYDGNYNGNYGALPTIAWVKSYDKGDGDSARGIVTDSHGNVVVAGNIGTIKYDPTGNPFWIAPYNGNSVATDSHDNMIVTGDSGTIKYDSQGNQIWAIPSGGNGVAADSKGNVVVTGSSNDDYLTIKYDSRGNQIWNRTYDSGDRDSAKGVAVDSDDNVIVTGWTTHTIKYPPGISYVHGSYTYSRTIKYDSRGNQLWVETYIYDRLHLGYWVHSVAVDARDNVIVTGTSGGDGSYDYHTVKYDSSGNELWNATYDGGRYNNAYGVAVDSSDNIYVTGRSSLFVRYPNYFNYIYLTVKYDSDGNPLWKFTYDGGINDLARGVAVDSRDNVVVTGESNGDYFTIKLCSEEPPNDVPQHMNWDKTTNPRGR